MENALTKWLLGIMFLVATSALSLLFAFPVMWCWNHAVTATFGLPAITWGKAWCLMWLATVFFKPVLVENRR